MNSNELKATIISLFPLEINEPKPGLYPGYFVIPAAPLGDFSYLVVGDAVFYQESKNEQMLTIRTPFHILAESIVHDFMTGHVGRVIGEAEPGVFWVPGGYDNKKLIKAKFQNEIDEAEKKQLRWFEELVRMADDVFQRTQRHSSVNQLQRLAAKRLGISRPWGLRTGDSENTCPFCKFEVPFGAVRCPNCREIINKDAYDKILKSLGV